ncbi:MAG: PP2C family protein-serine/threonine phosphatase [Thermoanaerobaculia bacterium]
MARLRDWVDLGKSTITSLKKSDVTNLYAFEWPETRRILIADHSAAIERDPRRLRRFVRSRSAMLHGLAKRLAPHRRVLFVVSFLWFFTCLVTIFGRIEDAPLWPFVEITATFMIMTLLLAMELIDKIKYRDELELARDLQSDLIPAHPAQTAQYAIAAHNRIANTVGGDIYDFVPLPDGRLGVLFGDASGHGMAAGLVMAVAHAAFRTQLDVDPSPAAIVGSLNRILCRTGGPRSFFSCCFVLFEEDGTFRAAVAGHPQIVRVGRDGKVVERIGKGSYPLGVKQPMEWPELQGSLQPGERLLFHSDGLTEARDAHDRDFDDSFVDAIAGWEPSATASAMVSNIVEEWQRFTGGRPLEDDVSVAVIERRRGISPHAD